MQTARGASRRVIGSARRWFRDFRRTRPFWGALWTILAGVWIIHGMSFAIGLVLHAGWSYQAGYVMGGGLVLFGLLAWFAPFYKGLAGAMAFLLALGAFPTANLGGYLIGSLVGVLGASMIISWGEKRPRRARKGVAGDGAPA